MAIKTVTIEFNEREVGLIATAIACKRASLSRSVNSASDSELRAVYSRQLGEYVDLNRKFQGGV